MMMAFQIGVSEPAARLGPHSGAGFVDGAVHLRASTLRRSCACRIWLSSYCRSKRIEGRLGARSWPDASGSSRFDLKCSIHRNQQRGVSHQLKAEA